LLDVATSPTGRILYVQANMVRFEDKRGGGMKEDALNRRDFIKKSAECVAYSAAATFLPGLWKGAGAAQRNPDLIVARGNPGPATRAGLEALGGIRRFVQAGSKVVIKPNMSFPNPPEWATTTHPDVVRELAEMCLKGGAFSVLILDNPLRSAEISLERSGIRSACSDLSNTRVHGVTNRRFFQEVKIPHAETLTTTMVMKEVLEADVLIAVPVAKSHSATGVSLSMKGMMGLVYDRRTFHLDMDLDTAVVDLCTILKPDLTVIDCSRILSDGGPGGPGKVIPMNKIIVSQDFVAADAMAVEMGTWYGRTFKGHQVKHIQMAHARGLGNMDVSSLVVKEVQSS
jgi:uncharacterized protein (DUF362 family)